MMLNNICAPTLIYLVFSITQIIIDTFKGMYNTALFKFIVMIIMALLLNALCASGMTVISWLIVFIPFIFMTVIVTILLYIFGLDPTTGKIEEEEPIPVSKTSGNLIFSRQFIDSNTNNSNTNSNKDPEKI
jgi:predicted membrane protein